jgi:hypothetical protein
MTCRRAVVDQGFATPHIQKPTEVGYTHLELERCGHTVQRLQPIGLRVLLVLVQINKSGSHNETPNLDDASPNHRFGGDSGNPIAAHANVPDPVETSLWVHHAAPLQHDVEGLAGDSEGCRECD